MAVITKGLSFTPRSKPGFQWEVPVEKLPLSRTEFFIPLAQLKLEGPERLKGVKEYFL